MDKKKLIEVLKQRASGLWGGRESLINNLAARKRLQLKFDPNKPLGFWHPSLEFVDVPDKPAPAVQQPRSEEHTSELQSHLNLVCRLLLATEIGRASCRERV